MHFSGKNRDGELRRIGFGIDGHALKGIHNIGNFDVGGTSNLAGVTRCAEPRGEAAEDILFVTGFDHGYNLSRGVVHVFSHGTGAAAGAALNAFIDFVAMGEFFDSVGESSVQIILKYDFTLEFHRSSFNGFYREMVYGKGSV